MNFKTTIFLLIVVGLLGFMAWYVGQPKSAAEIAAETRPVRSDYQPLLEPPLTETDLRRFRLERPGRPALVFERSAAEAGARPEWRMVEPLAGPTESFAVSSLVGTFTSLQYRFEFTPAQLSEAEAGLTEPLAAAELTTVTDQTTRIVVGGRAAMGSETYVRLNDKPVIYAVNRELGPEVRKEAAEYRAKRLLTPTRDSIVALTMEHEGRMYAFRKGSDGEWIIEQPIQEFADSSKLTALLNHMTGLRAESFVEQPPLLGEAADADPYLRLIVTSEQRKPLPPDPAPPDAEPETAPEPRFETITLTAELRVGGFADLTSEKRFVRVGDQPGLAVVRQEDIARLIPRINELRKAVVTRVKAADATQLELTLGEESARVRREGGAWVGEGDLAQLEPGAVADVVQAFEQLSAIDYIDQPANLADYGLDAPRAVVTITPGPAAPVTLKIGKDTESGRNTYVQREGGATVYVVAAQQAARMMLSPLALRSREIFTVSPDRISRVEVARGETRYVIVQDGSSLRLEEPAGAPPDAGALRTLVNDLARLRARRVAARSAAPEFGLSEPDLTLTFEVVAESPPPDSDESEIGRPVTGVTYRLVVARPSQTAFARKDDQPWVFELDDSLYRSFTAELIDPLVWSFHSAEVESFSMVSTGGALEFNKTDGVWKFAGDPYVAVTQRRVTEFLDDLARLRAERYFIYREADLDAEGFDDAPATLTLKLSGGRTLTLKLRQEMPGQLPLHAALVEARRTFRLRTADVEKMMRGLDYYLRPEGGDGDSSAPPLER